MPNIDRFLSAALVGASLVMAGSLVHRELANRDSPAAMEYAKPEWVPTWPSLLDIGVRLGNPRAPVKIVEFGDFECPYCKAFNAAEATVRKQLGDSVSVTFVHFPLTMHRFARGASRAAECAEALTRFDQMKDALFAKQDSFGLKSWASFAQDVGIQDTTSFHKCALDTARVPRIEAGLAAGAHLGVHGTPTIIINGWRLAAPPADSELLKTVRMIAEHKAPYSGEPTNHTSLRNR